MNGKLIDLSTKELLRKFGAGNHKPGSGSAVAFQGLLSTQLIRTLLELTKKKPRYSQWLPRLNEIEGEVENRIYPALLNLFQLDSEQFDHVYQLRVARDQETNNLKKIELKQALNDAMIPATETPILIAKLCVELANFALFLFDFGFQTARGDSGVALNNAIAAIAGCLSIINLNLLSLGNNSQTEQFRIEATSLKDRHSELSFKANERLTVLESEAEHHKKYHQELQTLSSGQWVDSNLSYAEIEGLARRLQNALWLYNDKLVKGELPENLIELLKPSVVLTKILNYRYNELPTLGQHLVGDELFEIAGIIDKSEKSVAVSRKFPKETQNFTAAHELGHALLHRQTILHRDKAIDGSTIGNSRDLIELQADKFATFFLMPKKQVTGIFRQLFFTEKFVVNKDSIFELTAGGADDFNKKYKNLRDLSRFLAAAESYRGQPFKSMADVFHVSSTTMAIRLEELGLVEF